jgi:hypothetical protein
MRLAVALVVVLAALECGPDKVRSTLSAQSPDIEALRQRVGTAVRRFITDFSNVVTEEEYEQRFAVGTRKRRLKSDFLLVAYPGRPQFVMVFRDVREVDGKAVGDKQERITKLFLQPFDNAIRRAQDIHREGLRRSVDNGRLSDPLTAIGYLQPEYQAGFRFSLGDPAPNLGPDVRVIDLVPTPARGRTAKQTRAWVSESTGDVLKTEVRAGFGARAEITTTTFGVDPVLRIRVPIDMRDEMPRGTNDEFIGTAKYTNIRRFDVKTDAVVDVPVDPNPR